MKSQLIALFAAGSIASTGISVPTQARANDEFVKFLVGAAIIGAIASAANSFNNPATVTHGYHGNNHKVHKPKKNKHSHVKRKKPKKCLRQRWTNHGWKTFYGKRCMQERGYHRHSGKGWHKHIRHAHR